MGRFVRLLPDLCTASLSKDVKLFKVYLGPQPLSLEPERNALSWSVLAQAPDQQVAAQVARDVYREQFTGGTPQHFRVVELLLPESGVGHVTEPASYGEPVEVTCDAYT